MKYERILGLVQHRAKLASEADAVTAVRATLETLAERITADEAKDLGAQLPREIKRFLTPEFRGLSFDLKGFFERVAKKEALPIGTATYHARVVIEVIGEAVSAGEMEDVRRQLPQEFAPLFDSGSKGPLFASP